MKRLAAIGVVHELHVCDDGMFVVRGGMFMDDVLRLPHDLAAELVRQIQDELQRRCWHCGHHVTKPPCAADLATKGQRAHWPKKRKAKRRK